MKRKGPTGVHRGARPRSSTPCAQGFRGFEPELGRLLGRLPAADGLLTRGALDGRAAGALAGARGADLTGALRDGADRDGLTDRLDGARGADLIGALRDGTDRDGLTDRLDGDRGADLIGALRDGVDRDGTTDRLAVGALLSALRDVGAVRGVDTLDDVGTLRAADVLRLVCELDADLLVTDLLVGVILRADELGCDWRVATGERLPVTSPARLVELMLRRALELVGEVLPATLGMVRLPLADIPLAVGDELEAANLLAALEDGT